MEAFATGKNLALFIENGEKRSALRQKLIHGGVKAEPWCPVCLRTHEDGGYTFFKCKQVKHIRRAAQTEDIRKNLSVCCSPKDVLIQIFKLDQRKSATTSILMWLW